MHQHRTPSRTRFALFAASALALALSLATTTPTAGAPVAEQADNDRLSLNGTGRYADQLAQIVLEYGVDVAHYPYALLVEFEPGADPADSADSLTARFSTWVIPEGTLMIILGCTRVRRLCTFFIK